MDVMWPMEGLDELNFSWGGMPFLTYAIELGPYSSTSLGPVSITIGRMDEDEAKRRYNLWYKRTVPGGRERCIGELEVYTQPDPLIMEAGGERKVDLVIEKHRRKRLYGKLLISPPPDIGLSSRAFEVRMDEHTPVCRVTTQIKAPKKLGAWRIPLTLNTSYGIIEKPLDLVVGHGPGDVRVDVSGREAMMDNGLLEMRVSADYARLFTA